MKKTNKVAVALYSNGRAHACALLLAAVTAIAALGFGIVACQKRTAVNSAVKETPETPILAEGIGPDLPPVGRSLFDHLVANTEANGQVSLKVPFPFEKVVELVGNKLRSPPIGVMFPKGRSLQRNAAAPNFFQFPRLVVAALSEPSQSNNDLGVLLRDRLYIGYVEPSKRLEVISYNEEAGRFEFQVVVDYDAPPAVPKVAYASRALCLSCHQNHSPLFSQFPWQESNAEERISKAIKAAMPGKSHYFGLPLEVPAAKPYAIDAATDRVNFTIPYQRLWVDGCGRADKDAPRCRAHVLQFALEYAITHTFSFESKTYAELKGFWDRFWPVAFPDGLAIVSADVKNFFPLDGNGSADSSGSVADILNKNSDLTPADSERLKKLLSMGSLPADVEPLSPRGEPLEVWENGESGDPNRIIYGLGDFFADADRAALQGASGGDFGKIAEAVQRLGDKARSGESDALSARAFSRPVVLKALLAELGVSPVPSVCCDGVKGFPEPVFEDNVTTSGASTDPNLKLFLKYCAACHGEASVDNFGFVKGKTVAEVRSRLVVHAKDHIARLHWEKNPPNLMPPIGTPMNDELTKNPEHRRQMRSYLCTLAPTAASEPGCQDLSGQK